MTEASRAAARGKKADPGRASAGGGKRKPIRYAVVGQGYISQVAVLPAFAHARKNTRLAALISDDPVKLEALSETYGVERTGGYQDYDALLASGEIDAVYIALPNHMHLDYTVRAARAGIHVLCEKPMAVTQRECEKMIAECDKQRVKLMIAYRLHFERANLTAIETLKAGKIGTPRIFNALFTMQVADEDNIRLRQQTGGGTLYDIGVYCINAARYLFGDEPTEVFGITANNGEARFSQVEEMSSAVMRFPGDRIATFTCSFGTTRSSSYEVIGTQGSLRASPAFGYAEDLKHTLTVDGKTRERVFPQRDQFAAELLYFSDCILNDQQPEPSGREGLIDVAIVNALYRSAKTARIVRLPGFEKDVRPAMEQEVSRPAVKKPKLVRAVGPSGG